MKRTPRIPWTSFPPALSRLSALQQTSRRRTTVVAKKDLGLCYQPSSMVETFPHSGMPGFARTLKFPGLARRGAMIPDLSLSLLMIKGKVDRSLGERRHLLAIGPYPWVFNTATWPTRVRLKGPSPASRQRMPSLHDSTQPRR